MGNKKDGGSAFPLPWRTAETGDALPGMSLRDWFAGMAIMGQSTFLDDTERGLAVDLARQQAKNAYRLADAMIEEGSK